MREVFSILPATMRSPAPTQTGICRHAAPPDAGADMTNTLEAVLSSQQQGNPLQ
jgi:hypothetical protein